jgi:hypothetical protein
MFRPRGRETKSIVLRLRSTILSFPFRFPNPLLFLCSTSPHWCYAPFYNNPFPLAPTRFAPTSLARPLFLLGIRLKQTRFAQTIK